MALENAFEGLAVESKQTAQITALGAVNETAPDTDTASSGLNGRTQRIAQRLTSLLALLPGSLGQKARVASLAVTLSAEDVAAITPPAAITGFATAAGQTAGNASLASIDAGVPAGLGQAAREASMPVALASEDVAALTPAAAITGYSTAAKQDTAQATLESLDGKLSDVSGVWGYKGGVSGSVSVPAGGKVLQISAVALESAGTVQINGGDIVPVPYGATDKVSCDLGIEPRGNLVAPTIVFTGTKSYFVEYVV